MLSRRRVLSGALAGLFAGTALPQPLLAEEMRSSLRPKLRGDGAGSASASAPAQATVIADADSLVAAAKLSGRVTYILADALTGQVLEAREEQVPMPPASVTKAVTALYALEKLAPGRRFATRLLAGGPLRGGVIEGDLILAGGGDPTLQTDQLGALAASLAQRGVKSVSGAFLYVDTALPQLSRIVADQPDHVGYNPALSGLNLNFNRVHFEWKRAAPGWKTSMEARGERFSPPVALASIKVAERLTPLFTYKASGTKENWTVASAALGKGGSRWLPVRQPGLYTAEVFRSLARAHGIALPEPKAARQAKGEELARVESAALPEVLREMLRWSTNLTAECCGLQASGAADLAASGRDMSAWTRQSFGIAGQFADHSGLGGASRVTAADMAKLLGQANREGRGLKVILRDTPMRDAAGKAIKNHPVKIRAKSGTLNFVSALAGYISPPGGRELVFAIFTGDPARRDGVPVAERENPPGSEAWISRSRKLQGQLINRWAAVYA